ncbi:MAG TPA: ATP-binding protein [Chloroflexota bacterium]|jgi:nitrogen-specific signal transduction histidine kinase|nr:ATP-binding protein [Chloroflexota bacterium]
MAATEFRSSAPLTSQAGQAALAPSAPQSIQSAVVQLVDPREMLMPMLEGLSRALGYRRAVVALYDPARGALRGTIGLNVSDALVASIEIPLDQADSPMVVALREGVPLRVDDTRTQSRLGGDALGLLLEMDISSFVVVPLRSSSEQFGLATWQGRDVPAVGVAILSKDDLITDADIERLMPFATQAGEALVRASDVERLKDSSEQHAVEKEWLYWMVNGFADPVVLTDANNDIILENLRAETLFKANAEDSEGKRRAITMNNFLFTAALSTIKLEHSAAGRFTRDLTLVDPIEGTELLFEMRTLPATNYFNGARGTVAVLTNITDLRHATEQVTENVYRLQTAEEEIRLERDRLNLIMRSVPNPIILMDIINQPILMNHEALRLFQASPLDSHRGRRAQVCMSNEAKFTSFVSQVRLDPAQGMSGEIVLTDPDSREPLAMSVTSTEVRDELGAVAATVSVMQDVSRLRELERRRLEQILFDSEKLAATGRLAASIAHEINNPLEAIKNALYLLTNKISADDPNAKFLQIATKETDRVSRILRQMLGFYRPPKMEPTDINRLIEDSEALIEKHLRQNRIKIENDLDPSLPLIIASADQIRQVLLNLMLNAQQAMSEGGTLFVSTRVSHGADPEFLMSDSVHVQIRDTGNGIPEEHLAHIFEPFFSTKDEKGTGLGLWVSQGIVQAHGGSIKLRSREGRGTTFSVALPIGGPAEHAER